MKTQRESRGFSHCLTAVLAFAAGVVITDWCTQVQAERTRDATARCEQSGGQMVLNRFGRLHCRRGGAIWTPAPRQRGDAQ